MVRAGAQMWYFLLRSTCVSERIRILQHWQPLTAAYLTDIIKTGAYSALAFLPFVALTLSLHAQLWLAFDCFIQLQCFMSSPPICKAKLLFRVGCRSFRVMLILAAQCSAQPEQAESVMLVLAAGISDSGAFHRSVS